MVDMTYSTQYVREAPEVEAYKLGLLQEAQNLYNQPMNIPAVEAAALSGTEQQGIDFAKQGVGAFEPFIQAGAQGVTQGMDLTQQGALAAGAVDTTSQYQAAQDMMGRAAPVIGQGIGGILGSAQAYDPNQAASYMNPYQEQVTQNALGEMRRQADIAQTGQAAQAVGSGAFGGTREGVQRAETERGVQDLMQQRIMQDYANNYAQAQQASMQGFESQQQRQLAGGQALGQAGMQFGQLGQGIGGLTAQQAGVDINKASALGSLGGQMGSLGTQYGALGQATQQLGAADTGLLMGLGGLERQNEQAQIDAIRSTQMQESMAPYQQLGFVSDIYRGAPSTSMALTSQTAPSASPLQTAVGLGVGALTTAAGAAKVF
tara:strand:- start:1450 stop:2574 length:1125 start_codon:yes stop_codon:yes gene_type:complete